MRVPGPGDLFVGKYRVDRLLGEGGFAKVFGATDGAGRRVALKILEPDGPDYPTDTVARFEREVRIVGGLRDPHTVTMYDSGRAADGLLYMVFEYVPGRDLSDLLAEVGKLGARDAIHIMRQILMSLREAHAAGLLHRDIKPENVRVYPSLDDPLAVKLLDFGIAKAPDRDRGVTRTGELVGTPRYMSPEQLLDKPLHPASDIYSLGLVMFEMVLGDDLSRGGSWGDQLDRLQSGYVFSMPEIERLGAGLLEILNRMVARDPEQRYSSCDAVLGALRALDNPRPVADRSYDRLEKATAAQAASGNLRYVLGAVLAGIAVAVAFLFVSVGQHEENSPTSPPPNRVPSALVKQQVDEPIERGTADATLDCASNAPFIGTGELEEISGLTVETLTVHIPKTYCTTAVPLVLLLPPDHIQPLAFLHQTGLTRVADEQGFVVAVPFDRELAAWTRPDDILTVQRAADWAQNELQIDDSRVFAVGHNNAGKTIERLSCVDWITAIATTSHRPSTSDYVCEEAPPIPFIALSPTKTDHMPVEGGENCYGGQKISLAAFEKRWRDRNSCGSKRRLAEHHETSDCYTWDCKASFVTCHLDGGLGWPGSPARPAADWNGCDGVPPEFPSGDVIWAFFDSVAKDD